MKIVDFIAALNTEFHGGSPFEGITAEGDKAVHGWFEAQGIFDQVVSKIGTLLSIEVGVWQGKSAIYTAQKMAEKSDDFGIICVDTWLGSIEHRLNPRWRDDLQLKNGFPQIYDKFLENIVAHGLEKHIFPLPLPSVQAATYLKMRGVQVAMIYIDGGHDYLSVASDLEHYWPLLAPNGVLIGDDYDPHAWPEVIRASNEFFENKPETLQVAGRNYVVQKSANS